MKLESAITRCHLWILTQDEVIQADESDRQPNGGWGYHGGDAHPSSACYVCDMSTQLGPFGRGDYLVATATEEAPTVEDGWSVKPAVDLEIADASCEETRSIAIMDASSSSCNEYELAIFER